jgi:hypothetical protein
MAVIRFKLDLSQLDDTAYGLDGFSPPFILDTSVLDGNGLLDGVEFLTTATASSSLGGLDANASATVTQFAVLSAPLGGLDANASATVVQFAVLSAPLGGLDATAIAQAEVFPVFTATLGGLVATATRTAPPPEPTPSGGRRVYSTSPRKKIEPLPQVEIPVIQPKRRYAVASAILDGASCMATSSITFSILDDDAEILLLV